MSILMALLFFIAGVYCVQRPARIAQRLVEAVKHASPGNAALSAWVETRGMVWSIRLLGLFALLNAVTLFYVAGHS